MATRSPLGTIQVVFCLEARLNFRTLLRNGEGVDNMPVSNWRLQFKHLPGHTISNRAEFL